MDLNICPWLDCSSEEHTHKVLFSIRSVLAPADVFSNRTIAEVIEQGFVGSVFTDATHEVRNVEQFSPFD